MVVTDFEPIREANLPYQLSFFSNDQSNIHLSVLKKGEDSDEAILRAVELEGVRSELKLSSYFDLKQLTRLNLIEEGINDSKSKTGSRLEPFSIETFRLR